MMLTSGGRPVHLTGSQAVALGPASLLKRRIAVPSGTAPLPRMDRLRLRVAPLLGSSSLFSKSLMDGITEVRKAKQESSFMGNVAEPSSSAHKANSYRPSPSPSSSAQRAKKKKPTLPLQALSGLEQLLPTPPQLLRPGEEGRACENKEPPEGVRPKGEAEVANEALTPPTPPPQVGGCLSSCWMR